MLIFTPDDMIVRANTCGTCKFFSENDECRRFPPQGKHFPTPDSNEWCGEFSWSDIKDCADREPLDQTGRAACSLHLLLAPGIWFMGCQGFLTIESSPMGPDVRLWWQYANPCDSVRHPLVSGTVDEVRDIAAKIIAAWPGTELIEDFE